MLGKREKKQHLVHFFYCYCSLLCHRQCCSPYFRRFVLLFTMREFYFYPPIMVAIKHYEILLGMTQTVYSAMVTAGSRFRYCRKELYFNYVAGFLICIWQEKHKAQFECSLSTHEKLWNCENFNFNFNFFLTLTINDWSKY